MKFAEVSKQYGAVTALDKITLELEEGKITALLGESGAGKSTLGRYLARALGWPFFDIETYYFPDTAGDYPYGTVRTREEVEPLLLADLRASPRCLLAAVKGAYGAEVEGLLTCAVLLDVPKEARLERVRQRSYRKFGDRMGPGGDLHDREEQFFRMVEGRSQGDVEAWLEGTGLPVLRLDAAQETARLAEAVVRFLEARRSPEQFDGEERP